MYFVLGDYASRFVIWIVALVAALEVIGNVAIALRNRVWFDFGVWLLVGAGVFGLGFVVERIKEQRGGF